MSSKEWHQKVISADKRRCLVKTTKEQRLLTREHYLKQKALSSGMIVNLIDDIDTLESENERLREAVKVMREVLEYQRRAWQWYVTGCHAVTDSGEMVKLAPDERTTKEAEMHKKYAREAISQVNALLKSEGE